MKKYKYQFDIVYGENDPHYKVGEKDSFISVETSLESGLNGLSWFLDDGDYTITGVTLLEIIEDEEHLKVLSHD